MKKLILFVVLICSFLSVKSFASIDQKELQTGDVLLQPLHCWSCNLIEGQEQSEYSHMGMVVRLNGVVHVAEAYGKVKIVTLKKFLSKTQKGKKVRVRRADFHYLAFEPVRYALIKKTLEYLGNPYDSAYRWDNKINGKEALYCSELVYKVMLDLIPFNHLAPKVMLFDVNPELWDRYFRGNTPRGQLGISPEDFNQSYDFYTLGEL